MSDDHLKPSEFLKSRGWKQVDPKADPCHTAWTHPDYPGREFVLVQAFLLQCHLDDTEVEK